MGVLGRQKKEILEEAGNSGKGNGREEGAK